MNTILKYSSSILKTCYIRRRNSKLLFTPPISFFSTHQFFQQQKNYQAHSSYQYPYFLPKQYPELLLKFQEMSYYEMADCIAKQQEKEKQGNVESSDISVGQLSFLFSSILKDRQEYHNAISLLYILNHEISEFYLSPNLGLNNQTQYNLELTNSLLEMSHLHARIGDKDQQRYYLTLAEEQSIDFLGTYEQRLEILFKFLSGYKDLNENLKAQQQIDKFMNLFDRIDYTEDNYPMYKDLLKYLIQTQEKQAIYKLTIKLIENFNENIDIKQDLQIDVLPIIVSSFLNDSFEGKGVRDTARQYRLEIGDSQSQRQNLKNRISDISKLKYENKIDDALILCNETLEIIMNEQPNNIPSDLLLIVFNNLFVLYSVKNDIERASEFGEKWIKLSERLNIPSSIVSSRSNVASFYQKGNRNDLAQKHIEMAVKTLNENSTCLDITDKFIVQCLHFQISYLNSHIQYTTANEHLKSVVHTLHSINSTQISNSLLLSKIIEMFTFLRNNQLKMQLKPFAQAYFVIKQQMRDIQVNRMDYIIKQELGEILFMEKEFDESIKQIVDAIRIYEKQQQQQKSDQSQNEAKTGYTQSARWISLQYIKACIEVNRGDIDKGFQTLSHYPIHIQDNNNSSEQSTTKDNKQIKHTNQAQQYWNLRLQVEIFMKLGQFSLAYDYANKALEKAQSIQDYSLQTNTHQLLKQISKEIPHLNQQINNNHDDDAIINLLEQKINKNTETFPTPTS